MCAIMKCLCQLGLGIQNLQRPDFGEAVDLNEGEIPVFWACGVTPQSIVMSSKLAYYLSY